LLILTGMLLGFRQRDLLSIHKSDEQKIALRKKEKRDRPCQRSANSTVPFFGCDSALASWTLCQNPVPRFGSLC
jgi:hypothetical protein